METIFGLSPTLVAAIAIFIGIYIVFFLIRIFADMVIVGFALTAAIATFYIDEFYDQYLALLGDAPILKMMGLVLPPQPETWAVFSIAGLLLVLAVLACIPFLPFSETYRFILGIEKVSMEKNEAKVRQWMAEEIENLDKNMDEDIVKTWVREEIANQDGLEEENTREWIRSEIEKMVAKTKLSEKSEKKTSYRRH